MNMREHIEAIREQKRCCCVYSLDAYPDAAMRLHIAINTALAEAERVDKDVERDRRKLKMIALRCRDYGCDCGVPDPDEPKCLSCLIVDILNGGVPFKHDEVEADNA